SDDACRNRAAARRAAGRREISPPPRSERRRLPPAARAWPRPGDELSDAPPQPKRGTRKWERGTGERTFLRCSAFRVPRSAFDRFNDLLYAAIQSFQAIGAHERPSQLRRLDHRTHLAQRREQTGELRVVMHRVG